MPRRRSLTGRSERQVDRNSRALSRAVVRGNNPVLIDKFKVALNLIPNNFISYDVGPMNLECECCKAKHFESEITMRNRTQFTACCHKGKVQLPPLMQNNFFNSFYNNFSATFELFGILLY